jgi:D-amino-acid dehydrogenase
VLHGLETENIGVERLAVEAGEVRGVVTTQNSYRATNVIIAGGAWSAQFAAQLGIPIPVKPARGQIIHLALPDNTTGNWPLVTAFHGHYLVPWPAGRVVIGATYEPEAGFAAQATAAGVQEVLGEGLRVAPGLAEAEIREIRVGLRPSSTEDGLPILGRVPGKHNVYLATGHGPYGLHLGPYSGKLITDWLSGKQEEPDGHQFHAGRF